MLNAIFGSISRVKILNLLLLSPEKKYQVQNLLLDLNLSSSMVRKELKNLVSFGILKEEKVKVEQEDALITKKTKSVLKEEKFYSANTKFLLYSEIKALFTKAQILFSQKFIDNLQRICQVKFLALTGVFTNYPESPTDILLVASVRRPAFLKLLAELEKELGREINFTILSLKEFKYREDIMDIFLYNILEGKSLILIDNIHQSS